VQERINRAEEIERAAAGMQQVAAMPCIETERAGDMRLDGKRRRLD
jgi:hypothetical protein